MSSQPPIIESPDLQSKAQRLGWGSLTLVFWLIYIHLWTPLITLVAWWVGVKLFNLHIVQLHGYTGLMEKLGLYLLVIFVISLVLIGWANLERFRFKDIHRRTAHAPTTTQEVAEKYHLEKNYLDKLRLKKSIIVYFSDKGKITDIVCVDDIRQRDYD